LTSLAVLVVLGALHVSRPLGDLVLHPVMLNNTSLVGTPVAAIGMAMAVSIFAYNGYGGAVNFSEEMREPEQHVARAILWALAITVTTELVPLTMVLLGARDLKALFSSQNIIGEFIAERGGATLNTVVSLGVALAILNGIIAMLLLAARMTFSTGRDRVWPTAVSEALSSVHSRFHSPWVATLVCGVLAALACLMNENLLLVVTGTGLILVYASLCLAAIVGRYRGTTAHTQYRMPLFPLPPIAALLMMGFVVYTSWLDPVIGRPSLFATFGIVILSAAYYSFVLRRRGVWVLRGPEDS
jgi:amino acid transporter